MSHPNYTLEQALDATVIPVDGAALESMIGAEVDRQIEHAQKYPRTIRKFQDELVTLATLDRETAESCTYSIPRGRKPIEGPSVRFAEMVYNAWGNLRVSTTFLMVDGRCALVRGQAHDLEKNNVLAMDIRRVVHKKKKNAQADDDDKQIAVAVATAIAKRNAILGSVPKSIWMKGLRAAQKCADGSGTIEERRTLFLAAYAKRGATEEQVLAALDVAGPEEITAADLRHLRGMLTAIKEGTLTMDEAMIHPGSEAKSGPSRMTPSSVVSVMANQATTPVETPHDPVTGEVQEYEPALPDGESEAAP